MREEFQNKIRMYESVNDVALKGEIVVFGSTFTANFPFYELSQKYVLSYAIYNRSIEGLTLSEAEEGLDVCVLQVKPSKIFLDLGEKDLENSSAFAVYQRIIMKIKAKLPETGVYLLPVRGDGAEKFNLGLRTLAEKTESKFLPLDLSDGKIVYGKIFKEMSRFFRKNPLSFCEAFALASK